MKWRQRCQPQQNQPTSQRNVLKTQCSSTFRSCRCPAGTKREGDRRCNRRVHEGQWRFPGLKPTPELRKRNKVKSDEGARGIRHRRRLRISLTSAVELGLGSSQLLESFTAAQPKRTRKGCLQILMEILTDWLVYKFGLSPDQDTRAARRTAKQTRDGKASRQRKAD